MAILYMFTLINHFHLIIVIQIWQGKTQDKNGLHQGLTALDKEPKLHFVMKIWSVL